jgi:acetyl-CoA C-acetyltransferase
MMDTVIVDVARSPIGRAYKGSLIGVRPDNMAATVSEALLSRQPAMPGEGINDVICGVATATAEQAYNAGRVIGQLAGLPDTVPGTTVNRFCASSLQATRMAHHAIQAGEGDAYLVVGVESVSRRTPAFEPGHMNPRMTDPSRPDYVNDMYINMVDTAERVADQMGVTREAMDEYAVLSQGRAVAAAERGDLAREIVPIESPDGLVEADDGLRPGTTMERLAALKPVVEGGRVTAGNACPLNDGAAAALITSADRARELGLEPRARILASHVTGLAPEIMGLGPIEACRGVLDRAGMKIGDVDTVELNEAFAAQVLPVCRELGVDIESQLNPLGGSIAFGHPFGMTGVRLLSTLLNGLELRDSTIGLATLCVGGGQGMAMLVERLK